MAKIEAAFKATDNLLKKANTVSKVFEEINKVTDFLDNISQVRARLDLVNDGLRTTDQFQRMIMNSANKSRESYQATANMVASLNQRAGEAFASNEESVAFVETLNKSFVIDKANQEARASARESLIQAFDSGVLSGQQFNKVFEATPSVIQTISDYMGVSIEQAKKMALEGSITADIIKNAMLGASDDINKIFGEIPATFSELGGMFTDNLLGTFEPVIQLMGQGAVWLADNFDLVISVFYGLASAATTYALGLGIQAAASLAAKIAQDGLNLSLLANPIMWVALGIGVLVGAIYKWVQSVGGVEVAWRIAMNNILIVWEHLKIGFFTGVYWIINLWDKLKIGILSAVMGIQNFIDDMRANVLMILQDMVNKAINIINDFISKLNNIPGVAIETISNVTFGTNEKLRNEAQKSLRDAFVDAHRSRAELASAEREAKLRAMENEISTIAKNRQDDVDRLKAKAIAERDISATKNGNSGGLDNTAHGMVEVPSNVARMANSMEASEEELKYLREAAEQEAVNRFTTAEIKVDMGGITNQVNDERDLDGMVTYLEEKLYEAMVVAAEGGHN